MRGRFPKLKSLGFVCVGVCALSFLANPDSGGVVGHLIAADASEGGKGKGGGGGDSVKGCQLSPPPADMTQNVPLNSHQLRNSRTILEVANENGLPEKAGVIALATAMQESTLNNIDYGHLDSVGLFQQRGEWGSFSDRTNPEKSADMFFNGGAAGQRGLKDIDGWQSMSVTDAAQAVQVSAFGDAYAQWEPMARNLVKQCN